MDFQDNNPIYLQIANYIIDHIITEKWKAGERIISVRELGAEIEVNPNTIARTYTYLSDLNLIYNKRGVGYFISDNAKGISLKLKENQFIESELPEIFKKMNLLKIDFNRLKELYDEKGFNKE